MEALLLDPQANYADHFIDLLWTEHGIRTVALHRSWRSRIAAGDRYPALGSSAVSAHYVIGARPLSDVARMLTERHQIGAVVPHHESTVLPLNELAERLGLDWAQPEVLPMFRDKGRLKEHLRRADPTLRVNRTHVVHSGGEAKRFLLDSGAERVVLKPNDGAGNVDVAFFDATATEEQLDAHIRGSAHAILAEEFIGGDEYYVNGQVDAAGEVFVVSASRYVRRPHAGKENVSVGDRVLRSTDPTFQALAQYARRVVHATGLRRSPFHLEAKVDDRGPCLIEVAARLCGVDVCFLEGRMHRTDILGIALEHYLRPVTGEPPLDWAAYDSRARGTSLGMTDRDGIIGELYGVDEVEAMPEFVRWMDKPRVGQKVRVTVDVPTCPWSAAFEAPDDAQLEAACSAAQDTVTWDDEDPGPRDRLKGAVTYAADKARVLAQAPRLIRRTTLRWH